MAVSNAQIDRLGEALRAVVELSASDLQLLQEFRIAHEPAMFAVQARLASSLGVQATSRLKTVNTIVDKLRRERVRLSQMQDIAGVRVVIEGGLHAQDRLVESLKAAFDGSRVIDRRAQPSHGYRAVHVIVRLDSRFVEIQVRTQLQDAWAQAVERLADRLGRGIRYGEASNIPVVTRLHSLSSFVYALERSQEKRRTLVSRPDKAAAGQRALRLMKAGLDRELEKERREIQAMLEEAVAELDDRQ